jgi:hypothetical protein
MEVVFYVDAEAVGEQTLVCLEVWHRPKNGVAAKGNWCYSARLTERLRLGTGARDTPTFL